MKFLMLLISLLTLSSTLQAKEIKLSHNTDYTPIFVWNANLLKLSDADTPIIDTTIKVGDNCPECKGTGTWVSGDGIHKKPCPHCLADGKVDTSDPILTGVYNTQEPSQEIPPSYNVKDPPLTEGTVSLPEETETWYFVYKGKPFYYQSDIDRFVSSLGEKLKINMSQEEWVKEGSINVCKYDSQGNRTECINCKIMKVKTPNQLFQKQTPNDYATPEESIDRVLQILNPQPNETFLDVGSGDGRIANEAARLYGCKAIGIEIDPERIALARKNAEQAGVSHLVTFIQGDFTRMRWPSADVGYVYLFPEDLSAIKSKLLNLDRFASFSHKVPSVPMSSNDNGTFYTWKFSPTPLMKSPGVLYGNKIYTWNNLPSNGRCNCPMCTYLKTELAKQGMY